MKLLERFDKYGFAKSELGVSGNDIRRAIAIAQAVDEWGEGMGKRLQSLAIESVLIRADELLQGGRNG